jgi:hypothetical protein
MFTYLEYHGAAPLTVLELDILADESFTIYQSRSDVVGLVDVLGVGK